MTKLIASFYPQTEPVPSPGYVFRSHRTGCKYMQARIHSIEAKLSILLKRFGVKRKQHAVLHGHLAHWLSRASLIYRDRSKFADPPVSHLPLLDNTDEEVSATLDNLLRTLMHGI